MYPLTQAISQGFSHEQVLEYLLRKFPKYSKDIQKALGQGFSASQVLQYLNGRKGSKEFEGELTEHEKTRKSDIEKQNTLERNIGKGALGLGAAALGAYGLGRVGQAAIPEILPAIQGIANPKQDVEIDLTPKIAHQAKQLEFQPPNEVIQQTTTPQPPASPQVSPPNPIQQPPTPQVDFGQILEQIGVKNKVDALRERNPPDIISKVIKYGLPKDQIKQLESQLQFPIDQVISGYLETAPPVKTMQEKIKSGVDFSPRPENLSKDSSVLLPDGQIGKIDSIKQGIAKVNVDGKDRNKKLDELIESPLPEKDLADLYKDVLSGIEKQTGQQVSRNVYWAGYDPITNELAFIPHHGSLYLYKDISPEDAQELTSYLTQRKTSGENYIGAWESGTKSPIGAAMSALIQRLQKKAGKGKEYSGKYEKIYDALEVAKLATKRKKREKRKT